MVYRLGSHDGGLKADEELLRAQLVIVINFCAGHKSPCLLLNLKGISSSHCLNISGREAV